MSTELTLKQTEFLKAYYDPNSDTFGNGVRSALKVYDTDDYNTACGIAHENLIKPNIRSLLEAKGIGIDRLIKSLDEGLEANKIVSAVVTGRDADERTNDFIEVPDYPTRHKYLETAGKWSGISTDDVNFNDNRKYYVVLPTRETIKGDIVEASS